MSYRLATETINLLVFNKRQIEIGGDILVEGKEFYCRLHVSMNVLTCMKHAMTCLEYFTLSLYVCLSLMQHFFKKLGVFTKFENVCMVLDVGMLLNN